MKANKLTQGQNLRWESSRMMLPEHIQALHDHAAGKEKVSKPILDDQEADRINRILRQSIEESRPLQIEYYDRGLIKKMIGCALRYDETSRTLHVNDRSGSPHKLKIDAIVNLR